MQTTNPNKWLIISISILLYMSLVGVTNYSLIQHPKENSPLAVRHKPTVMSPAIFVPLQEEISVGINDESGIQHHINMAITLVSRDEALKAVTQNHQPMIVNDLLALLGTQEYKSLISPEGKNAFQNKALKVVKATVKEQVGKDIIDSVLVTKFFID